MPTPVNDLQSFVIALSAETGDIATGTAVTYFRLPFGFTLTELPRGSVLTVDINVGASTPATILSTKLTIDASEKTSVTGSTPCVLSSSVFSSDDIVSFDIDGVGSSTAGVGLKVELIGVRT